MTRRLSGWGNAPSQSCAVFRPERLRELGRLVDAARGTGDDALTLIPRGLGRSYGDAALNENGGVVLQERLDRFLGFDPETGMLHCEAGVSYEQILETFLPRGWFPAVTPGTKYVTVGGAVAADIHGKNHHRDGSLANFVDEIELLTGTGEVLCCSRDENVDAFRATLGGMGLTGVIRSARLQLRPVETGYVRARYRKARNLDEALDLFAEKDVDHRYSAGWIDCLSSGSSLGRSVLIYGDHARADELPAALGGSAGRSDPGGRGDSPGRRPSDRMALRVPPDRKLTVPALTPGFLLNTLTIRLFNSLFYRLQPRGEQIVDYRSFFYPLDGILEWNRLYGSNGFAQFQAAFPERLDPGRPAGGGERTGRAGLVALLERIVRSRRASFLAVIKRFGPGDPDGGGLLSFPIPGYTLALDIPRRGDDFPSFMRELEEITLDHGGRVYLAKDAHLSAEAMESMYPHLPRFRKVKQRLDPEGVFSSSLARRVGIVEDDR